MKHFFLGLSFLFLFEEGSAFYCLDLFQNAESYQSLFARKKILERDLVVDASEPLDTKTKEHLTYLEITAKAVRDAISVRYDQEKINTVVYPAAGFDGASALLAFSQAELVIGIDNHPFVLVDAQTVQVKIPRLYGSELRKGWLFWRNVDTEGYTADMLLGRIFHAFKGLRFLRVAEFRDEMGLSHGLIEFDTGVGTPIRRYVHIHTVGKSSVWEDEAPWWLKNLRPMGFQGLLRKGAMSFFEDGDQKSMAIELLRILKKERGVFVDGDSYVLDNYNVTKERTFLHHFGYSENVQIFTFE